MMSELAGSLGFRSCQMMLELAGSFPIGQFEAFRPLFSIGVRISYERKHEGSLHT